MKKKQKSEIQKRANQKAKERIKKFESHQRTVADAENDDETHENRSITFYEKNELKDDDWHKEEYFYELPTR